MFPALDFLISSCSSFQVLFVSGKLIFGCCFKNFRLKSFSFSLPLSYQAFKVLEGGLMLLPLLTQFGSMWEKSGVNQNACVELPVTRPPTGGILHLEVQNQAVMV